MSGPPCNPPTSHRWQRIGVTDELQCVRCGNRKYDGLAARAAAPPVEPTGKYGDDDGDICPMCKQIVGAVPPPDPVAGLREALDVWERNGAPNRRSLEAFGIRPTLLAEPVPPRAAPCDDEQLKVAFMKGVQSAHESRAEPVPSETDDD